MSTVNTVTEQLTRAGQAIEHDSFAIIDAEVQGHSYTPEQWPIVRRMIHANADFDFNGMKRSDSFAGLVIDTILTFLLYTSPSPRDATLSRMPSSA